MTVVSCLYGHGYERFQRDWILSINHLDRKADDVVLMGDLAAYIPSFSDRVRCEWKYPQAFWLQRAIESAETDWVWILDIDDTALPDALNGIDDVEADVWAMGYVRSDGEVYVPPPLTANEVLSNPRNVIPAGSAIRTKAFHACGGYLDVALQDWALWRALARNGATFQTSGRAHYRYNRHPATRGETELTAARRAEHMAEMEAAEDERETAEFAAYVVENYAHP